jgi:SAM-dependent methyltransferase
MTTPGLPSDHDERRTDFYDRLAPWYHLIFEDWDASIARQGGQLDALIRGEWGPGVRTVLDAAAGIGTQALALAALGYEVTASDVSPVAVERARREAGTRGLTMGTAVADLRHLSAVHGAFDLVIACDNALPHLLDDGQLLQALTECLRCVVPGGGCLLSLRDYVVPAGPGRELRPYGVRQSGGTRYVLFQVWEWEPPHYDLALCIMEDAGAPECTTQVFRTRYYAVTVSRLAELMRAAGFERVRRIDAGYYQPVLVGTRPRSLRPS